ncbi:MAG: acyl carrier protein [Ignavibacteriales bacterium]|jgi:Phosphopantetheine attachment site.|nr:MAG: acyl carrier protein [Ignavibacteriaceae bacterium]MBW7873004.1 acyl carrier protein [Ignavibacteria bacterium]MCZ2142367.1 acyl carrier protein [Ignavibacteriales bacterium]OQY72732.1 MAG: hypothetical protein B6D45_08835 [Ignavibacteriales bacterium UTCHB3]MBV6445250.1 hypothetical protein [Ignavibacteriaceae bacterium]
MDIQQFTRYFESAVEGVPPGTLTPASRFRDEIPGWDSLAALAVLAMIDAEFDVTIKANDFIACTSIEEVFKLVKDAKGA